MALSAFFDKELPPTERQVARALGATAPLWELVQARILEQIPTMRTSWGFTNKAAGWSLRIRLEERVLAYLTPIDGCFLASFSMSDDAIAAAKELKLPKSMMAVLDTAATFVETRGVRFTVRSTSDVAMVVRLATICAKH